MDVALLEQIVALMASNDLNTVDLRDGGRRVILKRGAVQQTVFHAPPSQVSHAAPSAAPVGAAAAPSAPAAPADADAGLVPIKSPMVGTFYSKPSPDSKVFVTVGSTVDEETVVCVIEAMKTFNNVAAEMRGTIAKILVQDGSAVAFDTPLFLVKPA